MLSRGERNAEGRFRRCLGAMLVTVCFLAGEVAAQEVPTTFTIPEGVTILSENDLRTKIVGNTLAGVADGTKWVEYYAKDGTIRGKWGGDRYGGKWKISGSVMCFDYQGTEDDECNTIALEGNKGRLFLLDGLPSKYASVQYLEGNPKNLH